MTGQNTNNLSDAIRNLIVCDTQFGWTGETTLKLPELLDLQARGWLIEGDDNCEFSLTDEGQAVVARALRQDAPAELAEQQVGEAVPATFDDGGDYYADQHGLGAWATYLRNGKGWVYNFGYGDDAEIRAKSVARELNRQVAAITARMQVGEAQGDALVASLVQIMNAEYDGPRGRLPGDVLGVLNMAVEALAARQPGAQEPALFANRWEMEHGTAPGLVAMRAGRHLGIREFFTVPLYAAPPAQGIDLGPRPMDTAPCDGTMVRLLVQFTDNATEDTDGAAWTIGANNHDHNGEDVWKFAGWCWTHDHFTEGKGTPVGWLPLIDGQRDAAPGVSHG